MRPKAFSFQIDASKLSEKRALWLQGLRDEARWLYNHLVAWSSKSFVDDFGFTVHPNNLFEWDHRTRDIEVLEWLDGQRGEHLPYSLKHLGSHMIQDIAERMKRSLKSMTARRAVNPGSCPTPSNPGPQRAPAGWTNRVHAIFARKPLPSGRGNSPTENAMSSTPENKNTWTERFFGAQWGALHFVGQSLGSIAFGVRLAFDWARGLVDLNLRRQRAWTIAAADGDIETLRRLATSSPHCANRPLPRVGGAALQLLQIRGHAGRTPLQVAIASSRPACVAALIPLSDVNRLDAHGQTPLMQAAWLINSQAAHEIISLLLPHADPSVANAKGDTALHCATAGRNDSAFPLLFSDRRASADAQNKNGVSPLTQAASVGFVHMVETMIPRARAQNRADAFDAILTLVDNMGDAQGYASGNRVSAVETLRLLAPHSSRESMDQALAKLGTRAATFLPEEIAKREAETLRAYIAPSLASADETAPDSMSPSSQAATPTTRSTRCSGPPKRRI